MYLLQRKKSQFFYNTFSRKYLFHKLIHQQIWHIYNYVEQNTHCLLLFYENKYEKQYSRTFISLQFFDSVSKVCCLFLELRFEMENCLCANNFSSGSCLLEFIMRNNNEGLEGIIERLAKREKKLLLELSRNFERTLE